jgi:hypothetical protein
MQYMDVAIRHIPGLLGFIETEDPNFITFLSQGHSPFFGMRGGNVSE